MIAIILKYRKLSSNNNTTVHTLGCQALWNCHLELHENDEK